MRLSTGFVGTAWLLQSLSGQNLADLAWELLLQEEFPSWLFSVKQGATTVWERWNSYTLEDGFGIASMNSFNHYAYGAVLEWIAAKIGGIDYDETRPAGKLLHFAVELDQRLKNCQFALETPYGKAESSWKYEKEGFTWTIRIPVNCQGKICLPKINAEKFSLNGKEIQDSELNQENGLLLPSGTWRIKGSRQK